MWWRPWLCRAERPLAQLLHALAFYLPQPAAALRCSLQQVVGGSPKEGDYGGCCDVRGEALFESVGLDDDRGWLDPAVAAGQIPTSGTELYATALTPYVRLQTLFLQSLNLCHSCLQPGYIIHYKGKPCLVTCLGGVTGRCGYLCLLLLWSLTMYVSYGPARLDIREDVRDSLCRGWLWW